MKRIIRIAVAVVIVAVFAGTFVYLYQKSKKTPTLYETENAEYANISRTTVLNGNIEPRDKVEIKPQINGIIAEIYKHAGDVVHTGDIIAKVKVIPGMEELNSADDRVRVARINLEQAKRDYDRAKKLYDDKLISTEEFEKAQQDLKKAKEEKPYFSRRIANSKRGCFCIKQHLQHNSHTFHYQRNYSRHPGKGRKFGHNE